MSPQQGAGPAGGGIPKGVQSRPRDGLGEAFLIPFTITEDLRLHLRGTKLAQLENCLCASEHFEENAEILSINQAYSQLSINFEPKRRSHSGNVFTKIFFILGNLLLPLEELRLREVGKLERRLANQSGELGL